jgi:hypothetical protein
MRKKTRKYYTFVRKYCLKDFHHRSLQMENFDILGIFEVIVDSNWLRLLFYTLRNRTGMQTR